MSIIHDLGQLGVNGLVTQYAATRPAGDLRAPLTQNGGFISDIRIWMGLAGEVVGNYLGTDTIGGSILHTIGMGAAHSLMTTEVINYNAQQIRQAAQGRQVQVQQVQQVQQAPAGQFGPPVGPPPQQIGPGVVVRPVPQVQAAPVAGDFSGYGGW